MKEKYMAVPHSYALVTGATGGLGKAFSFALAKRGYHLLLTGRNMEKLSKLKADVEGKYPCEVRVYPADLSDAVSCEKMMGKIAGEGIKIALLANVAGADIQKGLEEYTQEKIRFQARVNFETAAALCHFAVKHRAERLEIVNVSSVSGLYPMPYFAIYSATKCALTAFSQALREEMRGKNVAVTAVLPGAMPTREDIKKQIKEQGLWGRLAVKSPETVAEISLNAVRKNKRKCIVGFWNKLMRVGTVWLPERLRLRFIARRWSKISKDAF